MRPALLALVLFSACAPQDRDLEALSAASHAVLEGDRDRAHAIYGDLVERDADPVLLAHLAADLEDEAARRRHLEAGAAAGDPWACYLLTWERPKAALETAADVAATVDNHEACRTRALEAGHDVEDYRYVDGLLSDLEREVRDGSALAKSLRDSLEAEGAFERHPRLRPGLEDA